MFLTTNPEELKIHFVLAYMETHFGMPANEHDKEFHYFNERGDIFGHFEHPFYSETIKKAFLNGTTLYSVEFKIKRNSGEWYVTSYDGNSDIEEKIRVANTFLKAFNFEQRPMDEFEPMPTQF
jgi:hypothetical protein